MSAEYESGVMAELSRSALVLGTAALDALAGVRVAVFGLGGVGSWAAEALVRTGVRHITLVDADNIALSNINRQAPATLQTVGEPKAEAMARHLRVLGHGVEVETCVETYCAATAPHFDFERYDYVIDAIDSLADKQLLLLKVAAASRPTLFSSMGAALKMDAGQISVAEFWKVKGCPLAAALRSRMRRSGQLPERKFMCVYSPERLVNRPEAFAGAAAEGVMTFGKVAVNGSLCHITASFGMRLAGLVIADVYRRYNA